MSRRVLFLCTANSCRSQMAEGLLRHFGGDRFVAASAGTNSSTVNPDAVRAMREIGVDISHHHSKSVETFLGQPFDYVVTVCDRARESCPTYPAANSVLHWPFDDPAALVGTVEERDACFRRVRDEIAERIRQFIQTHE